MDTSQIAAWYGPPGSLADEAPPDAPCPEGVQRLDGVTEETLTLAASLIAQGCSVTLTGVARVHRIVPHHANAEVGHVEFFGALGVLLPTNYTEAQTWADRGENLYNLGWRAESVECCLRALACDAGCAQAWLNLGRYFMDAEVGDFDAARRCCEMALALDPGMDMALANLGGIAFAQGKMKRAIELCSRAVEKNRDNFFGHYYLTAALLETGAAKEEVRRHALRCRALIEQCPAAAPGIEATLAWCEG